MRIGRSEEQGIRLAVRLAVAGEQLTVGELSEMEAMPEPTVGKLLNRLKRGGVVRSLRGRSGGYELSREPQEITVLDILDALGEPVLGGSHCVERADTEEPCPLAPSCGLRTVWAYIADLVGDVFSRTTIDDLRRATTDPGRGLRSLVKINGRTSPLASREEDGLSQQLLGADES